VFFAVFGVFIQGINIQRCAARGGVMRGEPPEVLERIDMGSEAISSLKAVSGADESLDDLLLRVAFGAVSAVPNVDGVSITMLDSAVACTVAYTDERVLPLDAEQYASRRGPCLEALDTRRAVRVAMASEEQRWPEFVAAARADGVRATLSIPLIVASTVAGQDDELVGSLNAYSRTTPAFDLVDEKLTCLYLDAASQAIAHARYRQRAQETIDQLERALASRPGIEQAIGALRVVHACTAEEAFAMLAERSQRENVKVRDLAHRVVEKLSRKTS
jgi:GAF domain-containing protein